MKKIIVNKTVAKRLEDLEKILCSDWHSVELRIYSFLRNLLNDSAYTNSLQDWFEENNFSVAELEQALKHGWEEIYEFKAGDIVMNNHHNELVHVVANGTTLDKWDRWSTVDFVKNSDPDTYTLVCKAEDRKDI